ncbi:beta-hexosaminidase subunit beta-like [Diabrotica undecimpunctata]|uniref:beta-hexosaminidase subunit beta-like n=1 Tax=Diabrotica undecimpunctata TaxID=50387 RepID=UPI003B638B6F
MHRIIFMIVALCVTFVHMYIEEPGPRFPPTKGEIWPKPFYQLKSNNSFLIDPRILNIKATRYECSLIRNAIVYYLHVISEGGVSEENKLKILKNNSNTRSSLHDPASVGLFETLEIKLDSPCTGNEFPSDDMLEDYTIIISEDVKQLNSSSVWGILRGLESFSQMIYIADHGLSLKINKTIVEDSPRFSHRGLLLDTSRHFIPLKTLLLTIDAMVFNKLNVFHWHIVDDQSFPYVSRKFPELSAKGAYTPYKTYSYADIKMVIEYARLKGIRVIPEFDTPGHTRSWGIAHPEILTACEKNYTGKYGPIDPTSNETYVFLNDLFTEISETFADRYIHIGGDEVEFECWSSSSKINEYMMENNIISYKELESLYIGKVINIVKKLNYKPIVWEEVFTNGVKLPADIVIQLWKDFWEIKMVEVTKSNRSAILSTCWYLDNIGSGGDWQKFYSCEPYSFTNDPILRTFVRGGEACMWGEVVNEFNVISRVWPRASAVAEKLWSQQELKDDIYEIERRLEEHTCRMIRRGIQAQPPNGPGFCY